MKKLVAVVALLIALGFVLPVHAESPTPGAPDRSVVIAVAKKLMEKVRYCALVTIGEDGQPQGRVLDSVPAEQDMTVWFGTNPLSRKVKQIRKDERVTLVYVNPDATGYVTLLGKAVIISDPKEREKHWKSEWKMFYKDEYKGDDYVLIKFSPKRIEVVSYPDNLFNQHETGLPNIVDLP